VVGYLLIAFVVFGVINNAILVRMKTRINSLTGDKVSWWQKDFYLRYGQISPESVLPAIARFSGWLCMGLVIAMIYFSLK
jgi:hypothetical protein